MQLKCRDISQAHNHAAASSVWTAHRSALCVSARPLALIPDKSQIMGLCWRAWPHSLALPSLLLLDAYKYSPGRVGNRLLTVLTSLHPSKSSPLTAEA